MILVNKENSYVTVVQKESRSASLPKSAIYTDFRVCLAWKGNATWEIDEETFEITQGDIILLSNGQKRHFTRFGEDGFCLYAFSLRRDVFANLQHFVFFLDCIKKRRFVLKQLPLAPILREAMEAIRNQDILCYEFASAKLTEFFIKLEKVLGYDYLAYEKIDREMLEVLDYMDSHLAGDIRLHTLAKKTGLTESAFSRRFLKLNGISFKQYVVAKRVDRASMLLQIGERKMEDIAQLCGFESVSGFYDAFKRTTGTTPSQYVRHAKGKKIAEW